MFSRHCAKKAASYYTSHSSLTAAKKRHRAALRPLFKRKTEGVSLQIKRRAFEARSWCSVVVWKEERVELHYEWIASDLCSRHYSCISLVLYIVCSGKYRVDTEPDLGWGRETSVGGESATDPRPLNIMNGACGLEADCLCVRPSRSHSGITLHVFLHLVTTSNLENAAHAKLENDWKTRFFFF